MRAGRLRRLYQTIGWLWLLSFLPGGAALAQDTTQPPGQKQKPAPGEEEKKEKDPRKPLPELSKTAYYDYQGQAAFILQHQFPFHSPYEGSGSFRSRDETELSHSYTLFLGLRVYKNLEIYVNPELALGNGVSRGEGVAGAVNGDLLGQSELRTEPYLARYFVRWRIPMPPLTHHENKAEVQKEQTGRAPNIIAGTVPRHRLVVQFGKFGVSDVFDTNAYANDPRTQFLNDAFGNNLAYDAAQETRGYNLGLTLAWINPSFVLRFGSFAMPTAAGGPDLAYSQERNHTEQIEAELYLPLLKRSRPPFVLRLLGYRNVGSMGRYRDALTSQAPGMAPDITAVRRSGAVKYGFGLNFEQALADGGDTGLFGRWGWNDGATESYSFAEADRFVSLGGQLSGVHWGRKEDRIGIALAQSDLSAVHRDYLAAGGEGLSVGDGRLRYGSEQILEAYYSYQVNKQWTLSLDYQYINHPGYNKDRGPASVVALRALLSF